MAIGDEVFEYIAGLGGERILAIWLLTVAALILSASFALHWRMLQYRARYNAQKRRYDEAMNALSQENARLKALLEEDEEALR